MDDAERLIWLRERAGLNQRQAAGQIGMSPSYLNYLEHGKAPLANIGGRLLRGMAATYRVGEAEVLGSPTPKQAAPRLRSLRLPVLGAIPCGRPAITEGVQSMKSEEYLDVVPSQMPKPSHEDRLYALRVSGDSLIGDQVHDGDFLIIDPGAPFVDGKIYVVCVEGECCARHVHKHGKKAMLRSSSGMTEIETDQLEIQGRAIAVNRMRAL